MDLYFGYIGILKKKVDSKEGSSINEVLRRICCLYSIELCHAYWNKKKSFKKKFFFFNLLSPPFSFYLFEDILREIEKKYFENSEMFWCRSILPFFYFVLFSFCCLLIKCKVMEIAWRKTNLVFHQFLFFLLLLI